MTQYLLDSAKGGGEEGRWRIKVFLRAQVGEGCKCPDGPCSLYLGNAEL